MNTMACTITVVCLALLLGGTCSAAEAEGRQSVGKEPQMAEVAMSQNNAQLRAWLDAIKPAAGGEVQPTVRKRPEYWQQSVRRENRGHMQE